MMRKFVVKMKVDLDFGLVESASPEMAILGLGQTVEEMVERMQEYTAAEVTHIEAIEATDSNG